MNTLFEHAEAARDAALERVVTNDPEFVSKAQSFVLDYLRSHGPTDSEQLTDLCKAAGIIPALSDRSFGAVFGGLSRSKAIVKSDVIQRNKGNRTYGNVVWRLAK